MRGFQREVLLKGGKIRVRRKLPEAKMRRRGTGGGKGNISPPQGGYIFSWVGGKISGEAGSASTCFLATKQTTAHTGSVMTLHFEPSPSPITFVIIIIITTMRMMLNVDDDNDQGGGLRQRQRQRQRQ